MQAQLDRMIEFMGMEAEERIEIIDAKAEEEFTIDKEKRQTLHDKIEISEMLNSARLRILRHKDDHVKSVLEEARVKLLGIINDNKIYTTILRSLLTQGLCQILEHEVVVRCKKEDREKVENIIPEALFEYEAKVNKYCRVKLETKKWVDENKIGGLEIFTQDGKVFVDNTLTARLDMIYQQMMPMMRRNLFVEDVEKSV